MDEIKNIYENSFSWVFNNVNDFIILLSEKGEIVDINSAALNLYNFKGDSLKGKNYFDLLASSNMEAPILFTELTKEITYPLSKQEKITVTNKQKYLIDWLIGRIINHDRPINYILYGKDVTSDKKEKANNLNKRELELLSKLNEEVTGASPNQYDTAEEYTEAIRYYLNSIIACMPGNVYWMNNNSIYLGCNNNVATMLGLKSPQEIVGKTYEEFSKFAGWNEEQIESFRKDDLQIITTGQPKLNVEEPPVPDAKGNIIQFLTSRVPIKDKQNRVVGVVGISIDITDRKKMEEELRIAKENAEAESHKKSLMVANMSHDVRTPLTGLTAMANLLYEGAHNSVEKEQVRNVLRCSQELSNLLISILENFASEHLKDEDIHSETFDLYRLIYSVYDFCLLNAQHKGLRLLKKIDPEAPHFVISDRDKLYRILLNLVANAIKFTEEGQITIELSNQGVLGNKAIVKFIISDTGIGISEEFKDKIFEKFIRETPSNKGKYKGYGLGLSTVQNYVTTLGGEIKVESQKGNGSSFFFELTLDIGKIEDVKPLDFDQEENAVITREEPISSQPAINIAPTNSSKSHTVLIVEDDAMAMLVANTLVTKEGHATLKATTGEQAFELAKSADYDLILSDIGLPGMSGDELAKKIREWEKSVGKKPVPIVALTGNGREPQVIKACMEAGMNKVLTKPPNIPELKATLKTFLSPSQIEAENSDSIQLGKAATEGLGFELPNTEAELFQLNFSLLDIEESVKILGSEDDFVASLPVLIKYIPSNNLDLQQAHEEKDWDKLRKLAHRIKSGALSLGATKMAYACRYLERYYLAGYRNTGILEKLYQQLLQVQNETEQYVKDFLDNQEKKR